ncbi:MAG: hypothetical protein A2445_05505 [Candidatus Jacksonbacteria bacterium RIFOXYC2_FULL_44_29]|nr:MAG: hypothetical protein UW45_C0038G0007 [Parcubacteria group bacterium GW2011_GWC2_44_22]OGY75911.1 MAG: hypothetical protein A2240_04135 [Candidatus Jacksonbacteria bacterium RIFOXYA2_FULL_43_12]OGY76924.1 MAG: hypothetical protein A2295_04920 [Candidatus Jacksonbacteria bacterium RIFOXYB2_FULL_44_15]OGY79466.1 MAG: hypothetical protein A2550_04130 [Candidatus Jacksonbacteria bacterium RIFOXYD2_FULL_43_21]OGY80988.1 MAG: hypothetical protein A2445_05505 [Candidatus Jacksonbacteria bacteri
MVILDTNIIIDHLRASKSGSATLLMRLSEIKPKELLALSVISVQELYTGQSTLDVQREQLLLGSIAPLKILPYTYEVAHLAGMIARDLPRPIALADAAIAAATIINGGQLFTLNQKHFQGIENLEFMTIG